MSYAVETYAYGRTSSEACEKTRQSLFNWDTFLSHGQLDYRRLSLHLWIIIGGERMKLKGDQQNIQKDIIFIIINPVYYWEFFERITI